MTRTDIYRQLMGEYVPIESEFEEGKPCAELYERMNKGAGTALRPNGNRL